MHRSSESASGKMIIFQFEGGSYDGVTIRSDEPPTDSNDACLLWALTRKGTIGRRFDMAVRNCPNLLHRYKVTNKFEQEHVVQVECRYVGESPPSDMSAIGPHASECGN